MAFEFKLPDVGEGIHEAVLVKWLVNTGDSIKEDDPFCEVETDKAVVELPSPVTGTVLKLNCEPGDLVHVGDVLIVFGDAGETVPDTDGKPSKPAKKESAPRKTIPAAKAPEQASAASPAPPAKHPPRRPLATPHTRALARKLGVDLNTVNGSGKGGRITDEDVEKAARGEQDVSKSAERSPAAPEAPAAPAAPVMDGEIEDTEFGQIERVKISRLRQVIARNMRASKDTLAHVTHVDEADVTDLYALYKKVKQQVADSHGVKFTIMPFFVKAVVASMKKYPVMNASFDDASDELLVKKYHHIGFAADTPEGLIVPVIRDADRKDMIRIAAEIADKAARARERKIKLDELQGAGFTITNVGAMGGLFATPVIPLPQLAILGMHAMKDRLVVKNGEIVIRKMMNISITFDHRIIDGMAAAGFLRDVIALIENTEMLMLRLV
ncbi:MAG TPA: dihydrolipoamide acetyltransferase family protein [bacterium]|nr:dihydrolipoamide acetyltransferase family protein [bacterium]